MKSSNKTAPTKEGDVVLPPAAAHSTSAVLLTTVNRSALLEDASSDNVSRSDAPSTEKVAERTATVRSLPSAESAASVAETTQRREEVAETTQRRERSSEEFTVR